MSRYLETWFLTRETISSMQQEALVRAFRQKGCRYSKYWDRNAAFKVQDKYGYRIPDYGWKDKTEEERVQHNLRYILDETIESRRKDGFYFDFNFGKEGVFKDIELSLGFNDSLAELFVSYSPEYTRSILKEPVARSIFGKSLDNIYHVGFSTPDFRSDDFLDDIITENHEVVRTQFIDFTKLMYAEVKDNFIAAFAMDYYSGGDFTYYYKFFGFSTLCWLTIFSPRAVNFLGKERLLSTPAWKVEELDGGSIMIVLSPQSFDFSVYDEHGVYQTELNGPDGQNQWARVLAERHLGMRKE